MICYEGIDYCFNIFGLDIMFLEDFTPIFIEANITPGSTWYHNRLLEGVMQEIVDEKIPPENRPKEVKRFIKL